MRLRFANEPSGEYSEADGGPEEQSAVAAPDRDEVVLYKGSGAAPEDVNLQMTNVKALARMPNLQKFAQDQADVTKARYGGTAIQDKPSAAAPYEKPEGDLAAQPRRFDRGAFEKIVYSKLGGNPFEIDPVAEINRATVNDLPQLFERVFQGEAIWEDRNRLSPKQQAFWQDEVRRYRAHVKESVDSERRNKIEMYKIMMSNFDAEHKSAEAAEKRVLEREKAWMGRAEKAEAASDKSAGRLTKLDQEERSILKRGAEILKDVDPLSKELKPEQVAEYRTIMEQLQGIKSERHTLKMKHDPAYQQQQAEQESERQKEAQQVRMKAGGADEKAAETPPQAAGSGTPSPGEVRKKLPTADTPKSDKGVVAVGGFKVRAGAKGAPSEVRRHTSGKLLAKYSDGSIEWVEEVK